ncbi:MAG: insulinase family protein [Chlamydiales bacterium]
MFLYLLLRMAISISIVFAPQLIAELPSNQKLTEITLNNGLKVCLKETDHEEAVFAFQLFAVGGYAALPLADRASAILAADIAWESGLRNQTADQIDIDLYDRSIEFSMEIRNFDRQILVSGPTTELSRCMQLIKALFEQPKFSPDAFKKALEAKRRDLQARKETKGSDLSAHEVFVSSNTRNWSVLQPLTLDELQTVNLQKSEKIFRECFADPSEFILVIAGDFKTAQVVKELEEHLGSMISPSSPKALVNPVPPSLPPGVTKKELKGFHRYSKTLTCLTFPLNSKAADRHSLDFLCFILESRLIGFLSKSDDAAKKINVTFEYPLYPCMDEVWLTIQFSSFTEEVHSISNNVLTALQTLKSQGVTHQEVLNFQRLQKNKGSQIWDNCEEIDLLANYYRASWDLKKIYQKTDFELNNLELFKNELNSYLKLDQYSIISLHP